MHAQHENRSTNIPFHFMLVLPKYFLTESILTGRDRARPCENHFPNTGMAFKCGAGLRAGRVS